MNAARSSPNVARVRFLSADYQQEPQRNIAANADQTDSSGEVLDKNPSPLNKL